MIGRGSLLALAAAAAMFGLQPPPLGEGRRMLEPEPEPAPKVTAEAIDAQRVARYKRDQFYLARAAEKRKRKALKLPASPAEVRP